MNSLIGNKPRIVLFNKADLSDYNELDKWVEYFENKGIKSLKINAITGQGLDKILPLMKVMLKEKIEKELSRGRTTRALRTMILGIPNVGKSTLINKLANKKKLVTADRPGVTRQTQYIRVGKDFELLDTPGILWPKFEDNDVAFKLALTGAIKDNILPTDDLCIYGFKYLDKHYRGRLESRYDITVDIDNPVDIYDQIGIRRGCLLRGNEIDYDRVSELFLHEFRHHKLGKLILDRVSDHV